MTRSDKKTRVLVLYGGRSGEHEISLQSAASVINHLDRDRFEIIPVAIDKNGRWLLNDLSLIGKSGKSLPVFENQPSVVLPPHSSAREQAALIALGDSREKKAIDVVFPVMHGPLCEDGSIQGLLELADVPYVGAGVLASAVCMDKDIAKRLVRDAGIPIVPYIAVKKEGWRRELVSIQERIARDLRYPIFVKPANLGSSVGVHKVKDSSSLTPAFDDAFLYDTKVLVEKAVSAREIEVAVLENADPSSPPSASIAGEIISRHEFYSYEAKYLDEKGAELQIPAKLSEEQMNEVRSLATRAFSVLECEGMGRVDFFLEKETDRFFFNEVNTIPGFTSISMYPKMWEASGVPYRELLSKLIELAIARHERKLKLVREFHAR